MTSTFTWLDYSERERRRMLDVISLFEEKDTRDELGIGVVRDALADMLFPGVSTIQTRARYFFFVPWIYLQLENDRIPPSRIATEARKAELDLVQPLIDAGEDQVFGRRAGRSLQRLPSSVYWNGLGVWGIRRFRGSQSEYHRQLDQFYRRLDAYCDSRRRYGTDDLATEHFTDIPHNWDPNLPKPPPGFRESTTLSLTRDEADYLCDCINLSAPKSYLAFLANIGLDGATVEFPWRHPWASEAPTEIRRVLNHARFFSLIFHGAALLYNLMLAEKSTREVLIDRYQNALAEWDRTASDKWPELKSWDRRDFWAMIDMQNARVAPGARRFITNWLDLVFSSSNLEALNEDFHARRLIEEREIQLKRGLARLRNPRALELWGGAAGTSRQTFRWPNVQTIVRDIDQALGRD